MIIRSPGNVQELRIPEPLATELIDRALVADSIARADLTELGVQDGEELMRRELTELSALVAEKLLGVLEDGEPEEPAGA